MPGVKTVRSSAEECAWNLESELKGELRDDSIGCWGSSLAHGAEEFLWHSFSPFSLLKDTESCFLVIGLNEAYPEQMGNSL